MTWFRVDDGLHAHKKVVRAGVPAMGLWLLAGSWASDQLTDGWVPDYIAARLDPDYREHAADLVRAGLWTEDEHDGDKGWWFHEWGDHQPSAESVQAKREQAKERMRRVREQRSSRSRERDANVREHDAERSRQVPGDGRTRRLRSDDTDPHNRDGGPISAESPAGSQDVRANTARTSREVRLTPTRPDPTSTTDSLRSSVEGSADKPRTTTRGTRIPDDFRVTPDMIAWARDKTPLVGTAETEAFVDWFRSAPGAKGIKTDWAAAWRNWMRRAQRDHETHHPAPRPQTNGHGVIALRPATRPSTTDDRVAAGLALAAKYDAMEAS